MEKFVIKNAHTGIDAVKGSVLVDDCVIENSVTSGIEAVLAANQTLRLRNCSIRNNNQHGVVAKGSTGTYTVDTDNCTFTSNQNYGVYIDTGDVRLRMTDCKLTNNYKNFRTYVSSGVVNIDECFFGQNRQRWGSWTAEVWMSTYNGQKASTVTKCSSAFTMILQGIYLTKTTYV